MTRTLRLLVVVTSVLAVAWPPSLAAASQNDPTSASCGPSDLPLGRVVPAQYIGAVHFITPNRGVGLTLPTLACATAGAPVAARFLTTVDGGRHWVAAGRFPERLAQRRLLTDDYSIPPMAFLSARRGWVLVTGRLLATSDGGRHWRTVSLGGSVVALSQRGSQVVAAVSDCWQTCVHDGTIRLFSFLAQASSWRGSSPIPVSTPTFGSRLVLGAQVGQAYLELGQYLHVPRLLVTDDGGSQWAAATQPCPDPGQFIVQNQPEYRYNQQEVTYLSLATAPSGAVWAFCASNSVPPAGALFVSDDNGRTWTRRWTSPNWAFEVWPAGDFTVLSDQVAIVTAGTEVLGTTDGGVQWSPMESLDDGTGVSDEPSLIETLSPQDVWYFTPSMLWHSVNGVRFSQVLPEGSGDPGGRLMGDLRLVGTAAPPGAVTSDAQEQEPVWIGFCSDEYLIRGWSELTYGVNFTTHLSRRKVLLDVSSRLASLGWGHRHANPGSGWVWSKQLSNGDTAQLILSPPFERYPWYFSATAPAVAPRGECVGA
jgi:hypothetical protein